VLLMMREGRATMRRATMRFALAAAVVTASGARAGVVITPIAQAGGSSPLSSVGLDPSINNSGAVAFGAIVAPSLTSNGGGAIEVGNGGAATPVVLTKNLGGSLLQVADPTINNAGVVAYHGDVTNSVRGTFTTAGPVVLAGPSPTYTYGNFGSSGNLPPALNNQGTAAVLALSNGVALNNGGESIVTGQGNGTAAVAVTTSLSGPFSSLYDPSINDAGTLAFAGTNLQGKTGVFVVAPGQSQPTTLALNGQGNFNGIGIAARINDQGQVAFTAYNGHYGIFLASDTSIQTVVDTTNSQFYQVAPFQHIALNNAGQVAYQATLANGVDQAIFSGTTRIVGTGDTLGGLKVTQVSMSSTAINDAGEVTFYAGLQDAQGHVTQGIFRYDPAGSTASNPLLPINTTGPYLFNIGLGSGYGPGLDVPVYIDPQFAVGYDYQVSGGPLFASVLLPSGLGTGQYELDRWDGSSYVFDAMVSAGTTFTFGSPVDRFQVRGIPAAAGLSPDDPQAFVTGLTFTGTGTADVAMTPITEQAGAVAAPEPSTLVGAATGVALALGYAWRRRRAKAAA
jgi:hypothetical protein